VSLAVSEEVCIPNISLAERRKRLLGGVIGLVITAAILAAMLVSGMDRWWRLALFLPFWGSTIGYFQWRDKT
jgi:hypothetical protein